MDVMIVLVTNLVYFKNTQKLVFVINGVKGLHLVYNMHHCSSS